VTAAVIVAIDCPWCAGTGVAEIDGVTVCCQCHPFDIIVPQSDVGATRDLHRATGISEQRMHS
jgi:hypothetical protein